jgi:23S rRNA (uracil1939-C5)-methyltransferase
VNQALASFRQVPALFDAIDELEINVSPEEGKGILILRQKRTDPPSHPRLQEMLNDHPVVKGAALMAKKGSRHWGNPSLTYTVSFQKEGKTGYVRLQASPESFFQVNLEQNRALVQTVLDFADLTGSERVLDLYAGIGNFTLPLAMEAHEVLGVEENGKAVEDGRLNVLENRIDRCRFICGKVEDVIRKIEDRRWDVVVLDPPRGGCKPIASLMAEWKPQRIVYVSCDPATLARDLPLLLEKGYVFEDLRLIDLFPQTYHMEVVGLLRLPSPRSRSGH